MNVDIRPKFEVEKIDEEVEETVFAYEEHKLGTGKDAKIVRRRTKKTVTRPFGYMLYTPRGDAIRVRTEEELRRLGADSPAPLVDLVSGEDVPASHTSFKEVAARRVARSYARSAATR